MRKTIYKLPDECANKQQFIWPKHFEKLKDPSHTKNPEINTIKLTNEKWNEMDVIVRYSMVNFPKSINLPYFDRFFPFCYFLSDPCSRIDLTTTCKSLSGFIRPWFSG